MLELNVTGVIRNRIASLMSTPGAKDLTVFVEEGVVSFAVIKEDMFKMFFFNISDKDPHVNYLLPGEIVNFLFTGTHVVLEEANEKLTLKSDTGNPAEFRQAVIPLRRDYSFDLIRDSVAFANQGEHHILQDTQVLRQFAELCKFQKTGVVLKDGWGMMDTPMFKVCRPIAYNSDLVLTERALTQFIAFTKDTSKIRMGRANRYNICVNTDNVIFGFVRVRNDLRSFVDSYKQLVPHAVYEVDVNKMSQLLFATKQEKTQEVDLSIDFGNGVIRVFERTKGEYLSFFPTTAIAKNKNIGNLKLNFKVVKSLLTTNINFGECIVKIFDSIVSFELKQGLIVMIKRGD